MNTFGSSTVQVPLVDPRDIITNRVRFKREMLPLLDKANSFYCPAGRWPSRGYILLTRANYARIDPYATDLRLYVGTLDPFLGLSIVTATCVTHGVTSAANAIYLVEITDTRGILWNRWFTKPTTRVGYNCDAPAYPQNLYSNTMNGAVPWTWSTMIGDLWPFGAYPGLPYVPQGAPDDNWCYGKAVWPYLCDTLEHLGMYVAVDPAVGYSIVIANATDAALAAQQLTYKQHLEDDLAPLDTGAGRVPVTVTVMFPRKNSEYGTEETIRRDSLQFETTPFYSVSIATPYTDATGTHFMWDEFMVRYDVDGAPLAADVAAAAVIAQERVTKYLANISGALHQVYGGALPFVTGSQVSGVLWKHTVMGWRTTIVKGQNPPWLEVWDDLC